MSGLAQTAAYANTTDPILLTSRVELQDTIQVDSALATAGINITELIGPTGVAAVAGGAAYPIYSLRDGQQFGAFAAQSPYLAGVATAGIAICKTGAGAVIAAGDFLAADALNTAVPAVAGNVVIGESLDSTDGSGTLADPLYVRVRLQRHIAA